MDEQEIIELLFNKLEEANEKKGYYKQRCEDLNLLNSKLQDKINKIDHNYSKQLHSLEVKNNELRQQLAKIDYEQSQEEE